VPVMYSTLDDIGDWMKKHWHGKKEA